MEDGQIVKLYFNREERAIRETARKYAAYCHSIAYRILESHPDAEEVVNDTYLGAWNSIPPTKPLSLSAYLGKISRRLALNRWRSGQRKKRGGGETALALEELEDCIPWGRSAQAELEGKELAESVNRFVRDLPRPSGGCLSCGTGTCTPSEKLPNNMIFPRARSSPLSAAPGRDCKTT